MVNHLLVLQSVFSRVEWSLSLSKGVPRTFVNLAEKRGSILIFIVPWIPAFAGMTEEGKSRLNPAYISAFVPILTAQETSSLQSVIAKWGCWR